MIIRKGIEEAEHCLTQSNESVEFPTFFSSRRLTPTHPNYFSSLCVLSARPCRFVCSSLSPHLIRSYSSRFSLLSVFSACKRYKQRTVCEKQSSSSSFKKRKVLYLSRECLQPNSANTEEKHSTQLPANIPLFPVLGIFSCYFPSHHPNTLPLAQNTYNCSHSYFNNKSYGRNVPTYYGGGCPCHRTI